MPPRPGIHPALRTSLLSVIGAGLFTIAPQAVDAARADLRVCNATQSLIGVAIGYRGEEGWVSEGWWRIPATTCRSVVEGQLASRYYYLYAEDADGVSRWAGNINLCIAENEFRVVGVADCFSRGYQEMGFREYDTGAQASWMVQLTEASRESQTPDLTVEDDANGIEEGAPEGEAPEEETTNP